MGIKEVLMKRDGMSEEAALDLIEQAKDALRAYLDEADLVGAEEVCDEFFGLEPDYIDELMF